MFHYVLNIFQPTQKKQAFTFQSIYGKIFKLAECDIVNWRQSIELQSMWI